MWFFALIYLIVGLVRENYLGFVANEYWCDQCRWMAESKRNAQLHVGKDEVLAHDGR